MTSRCCSSGKAVLVAVYAERPWRSHHHIYHHDFHQNVCKNDGRVRGYNRRAELLDYARHLRASAQSAAASASLPSHSFSHIKQPSTVQISSADRKRKHPTCFYKWKCVIPSFLRSMTTAFNTTIDKVKNNHNKCVSTTAKVKALEVQKKGSFLSELLRKLKKHR